MATPFSKSFRLAALSAGSTPRRYVASSSDSAHTGRSAATRHSCAYAAATSARGPAGGAAARGGGLAARRGGAPRSCALPAPVPRGAAPAPPAPAAGAAGRSNSVFPSAIAPVTSANTQPQKIM